MADRRLSPDEAALWAKVMATVRPIAARPVRVAQPMPAPASPPAPARKPAGRVPPLPAPPPPRAVTRPLAQHATLDGGWDRRLGRGTVAPDATVDLHGHSLASAHGLLDSALDRAIARGDRVVLLVTGKPPRAESERPHARGAIRAAVHDWLHASRHADAIAAVRGAHPRHGGAGALYIVLRRTRSERNS